MIVDVEDVTVVNAVAAGICVQMPTAAMAEIDMDFIFTTSNRLIEILVRRGRL